jgi:hypothetical protein
MVEDEKYGHPFCRHYSIVIHYSINGYFFLDSFNAVVIIFLGSFYEDINAVVFNLNIICF